jgi:hypothetical protein
MSAGAPWKTGGFGSMTFGEKFLMKVEDRTDFTLFRDNYVIYIAVI